MPRIPLSPLFLFFLLFNFVTPWRLLTVDPNSSPPPSSTSPPVFFKTLQEAIDAAEADDQIFIKTASSSPPFACSNITINTPNITLFGPPSLPSPLSAVQFDCRGLARALWISKNVQTFTMRNIGIMNGFDDYGGAALYFEPGIAEISLENCTFTNNSVTVLPSFTFSGGGGGAVSIPGVTKSVSIVGCSFVNNSVSILDSSLSSSASFSVSFWGGGGIGVNFLNATTTISPSPSSFSSLSLQNSHFIANSFVWYGAFGAIGNGAGGIAAIFPAKSTGDKVRYQINITQCNFEKNVFDATHIVTVASGSTNDAFLGGGGLGIFFLTAGSFSSSKPTFVNDNEDADCDGHSIEVSSSQFSSNQFHLQLQQQSSPLHKSIAFGAGGMQIAYLSGTTLLPNPVQKPSLTQTLQFLSHHLLFNNFVNNSMVVVSTPGSIAYVTNLIVIYGGAGGAAIVFNGLTTNQNSIFARHSQFTNNTFSSSLSLTGGATAIVSGMTIGGGGGLSILNNVANSISGSSVTLDGLTCIGNSISVQASGVANFISGGGGAVAILNAMSPMVSPLIASETYAITDSTLVSNGCWMDISAYFQHMAARSVTVGSGGLAVVLQGASYANQISSSSVSISSVSFINSIFDSSFAAGSTSVLAGSAAFSIAAVSMNSQANIFQVENVNVESNSAQVVGVSNAFCTAGGLVLMSGAGTMQNNIFQFSKRSIYKNNNLEVANSGGSNGYPPFIIANGGLSIAFASLSDIPVSTQNNTIIVDDCQFDSNYVLFSNPYASESAASGGFAITSPTVIAPSSGSYFVSNSKFSNNSVVATQIAGASALFGAGGIIFLETAFSESANQLFSLSGCLFSHNQFLAQGVKLSGSSSLSFAISSPSSSQIYGGGAVGVSYTAAAVPSGLGHYHTSITGNQHLVVNCTFSNNAIKATDGLNNYGGGAFGFLISQSFLILDTTFFSKDNHFIQNSMITSDQCGFGAGGLGFVYANGGATSNMSHIFTGVNVFEGNVLVSGMESIPAALATGGEGGANNGGGGEGLCCCFSGGGGLSIQYQDFNYNSQNTHLIDGAVFSNNSMVSVRDGSGGGAVGIMFSYSPTSTPISLSILGSLPVIYLVYQPSDYIIRNSKFLNNQAGWGSGAFALSGISSNVILQNTEVSGNVILKSGNANIGASGAGVLITGRMQVQVIDSQFTRNVVQFVGIGAGIYLSGNITASFVNSTFIANQASLGSDIAAVITSNQALSFDGVSVDATSSAPVYLKNDAGKGDAAAGFVDLSSTSTFRCAPGNALIVKGGGSVNTSSSSNSNNNRLELNCEECVGSTYDLQGGFLVGWNGPGISACRACPFGAECTGSTSLRASYGFWGTFFDTSSPSSSATTQRRRGGGGEEQSPDLDVVAQFTSCPFGYCTGGGGGGGVAQGSTPSLSLFALNGCAIGRNASIPLCGGCLNGFSQEVFSTQCMPNEKCSGDLWIWPAGVVYIGVIVTWYILAPISHSGWVMTVLFFYYQTVPLVLSSRTSWSSILISVLSLQLTQAGDGGQGNYDQHQGGVLSVCAVEGLTTTEGVALPLAILAGEIAMLLLSGVLMFLWKSACCMRAVFTWKRKLTTISGAGMKEISRIGNASLLVDGPARDGNDFFSHQHHHHDEDTDDEQQFHHRQHHMIRKRDILTIKYRLAAAATRMGLYAFTSIVRTFAALLHCVPVAGLAAGVTVLYDAGETECMQQWQILITCLLAVVIAPLPFFLGAFLFWIGRKRGGGVVGEGEEELGNASSATATSAPPPRSSSPPSSFDSFLQVVVGPFKSRYRFWNSVILLERLLLAMVHALVSDVSIRSVVLLILLGICLCAQSSLQPFVSRGGNIVATLALFSLICVGAISLRSNSFLVGDVNQIHVGQEEASDSLFGFTTFLLCWPAVVVLGVGLLQLWGIIRRKWFKRGGSFVWNPSLSSFPSLSFSYQQQH